jgi:hypothetical protein
MQTTRIPARARSCLAPSAYVGVDYMRYFKRDGVNVNGLTVGLGYRF